MPRTAWTDKRSEWRVQLRYGSGETNVKVDEVVKAFTSMEALKSVNPDLLPNSALPLVKIDVSLHMRGY